MGVVKNLMVRIVGDARGIVAAMKNAGSATSKASDKIKASSANMKRSVKDSFSSSRMSVRQYSEYVAKTKQDHETATQNVGRLSDKIGQMQSVYDSIKTATAGMDLSKPLAEMIVDAEKNLTKIESRAREVEKELASLSDSKGGGNPKKTSALQAELKKLSEKSEYAVMRLEHLNHVADKIGTKNIKFASNAGLKQLETEIRNVKNELNGAQIKADQTGQKLRSMGLAPTLKYVLKNIGTDAAKAATGGVKQLGSALKTVGGSAVRGIASLPGKLLGIGKSASAGCGGLNRMVRSIRNIGVVSLGMRVATGMFGQIRSIISSYISQNEALNASVTNMKNQLGEALAPAINIVIAALQRLMPIVTSVSNAINSIFTALFGKVASTTSAIKSSANAASNAASSLETYGFDQITKVSDNSGDGSSGSSGASSTASEQSGLVQKLTRWIQQLKDAFVAGDWQGLGKIIGDGLNNALNSINAVDIGSKAAGFANNVVTVLHSAFSTANFTGIGEKAGQMMTSAMEQVNWTKTGDTIGKALMALPSIIVGFLLKTNWSTVGKSVGQLLGGALSGVGNWIQSVDWLKLGDNIWNLITGIDYKSIAKGLFNSLGSALAAGPRLLQGFIKRVVKSVKDYFTKQIKLAGGDVAKGLLNGILNGLGNLLSWINDNIFKPFIDGFKNVFGIHSPSTIMEELGSYLGLGVLNGFKDKWRDLVAYLSEGLASVKSKLSDAWTNCRTITSQKWNDICGTVSSKLSDMKSSVSEKCKTIESQISDDWTKCRTTTAQKWSEICSTVSSKLSEMKSSVAEKIKGVESKLSDEWTKCCTATAEKWSDISSTVSEKIADLKSTTTKKLKNVRDSVSTVWSDMKQDASTAASNIAKKVTSGFENMKDGAVNAFSGLWSGAKRWINTLIGGVESMVNFVIRGVNEMIDAFNEITKVGEAFDVDLSIPRISEVSLPRLAKGAVVDGATTAVIGEAGKEAVVPLERNTGWMDTFAKRLIELGGGANGATIILQLMIGNRKLTEYIIKDINQITKSTGVCPIKV